MPDSRKAYCRYCACHVSLVTNNFATRAATKFFIYNVTFIDDCTPKF